MDDRDLLDRLRARPFRFGGETEAEAKERRQHDREVAAWRIEALTAERDRLRALVWAALDAWDIQDKDGGPMGDHWVSDARAALKGETP